MSRIETVIQTKLAAGRKVLIPYLVAGDPDLDVSLRLMHALVAAGADIIELGVPFSDPSSDGEVIQKGAERSLARGTTLIDVMELVAAFRKQDEHTPIVLMGYLNPVEIMGYEDFAAAAGDAGVDGVLLVDMPPTEADSLSALLADAEIDLIFLVAPTTSQERARLIAERCTGYLYYVSLKGVTGLAISDTESIAKNVELLRTYTEIPIVIGFGIKDPESAKRMGALADGVIIGSALVEKIAALADRQSIENAEIEASVELIAETRSSLDGSG
ncbi:MAG: tryptophan synthase subunit alpha [Gammaproteobacteria bacterium]|nr:tryptophan synthase subunit alpha [Gammaproteobacteria bacterium]